MAARKSFLLRIPPELFDELSRWAADELRSVNGHLEFLLRDAVREHRRGSAVAERRARPPAPDEEAQRGRPGDEEGKRT